MTEHECQFPEDMTWLRQIRRLAVALLIVFFGSVGAAAATIYSVGAQTAEMRSDTRHITEVANRNRDSVKELQENTEANHRETLRAIVRLETKIEDMGARAHERRE